MDCLSIYKVEVTMKNTLRYSLIFACTLTAGAAAQAADFEDYARVLSVTPQYEQVSTPRQECRTEYENVPRHSQRQERSNGGAIIGGIAGGLLGSQVGNGNGRVAAAAVRPPGLAVELVLAAVLPARRDGGRVATGLAGRDPLERRVRAARRGGARAHRGRQRQRLLRARRLTFSDASS